MTRLFTILFICSSLFSVKAIAQAPIFPYGDAFDSYTAGQPLNGSGGLAASAHVYVTPHGIVGNCAEFQMTSARKDSLSSPPIGPLTNRSAASFYFRIIKYVGGVATPYTLTGSDGAEVYVADVNFQLLVPQYPITSSNQNTDTNYIKVVVPAPNWANGNSGRFRIVATNNSGNSWLLQLDSFAVRDTAALPPVLTSSVTNSNCRGDSTGSITVHASGIPPYVYVWSTGGTDSTIDHLAAGSYTVTVTDSAGGRATLTDTVLAPQYQLLLDSLTHDNARCYGTASGAAAIYPRGGTPSYSYDWGSTPVQHTQQAQNLPAGNYSVTVTDANGCSVTATTQISQPPALTLSVSSTGSTNAFGNGTATAIANGGTSPFSYLWSNTGTTAIIAGLSPRCYRVTVTDYNGCTITDSTCVADMTLSVADIAGSTLTLYPNPASSQLHVTIDGQNIDASITIIDISGRTALEASTKDAYINVATVSEGIYTVRIQAADHTYVRRLVIQR